MMSFTEDKGAIKSMIELSDTWEEADKIINEFTPCRNTNEKLFYLYGMFDVSILASFDESDTKIENDYKAVLSAIVNQKWR
ncbi:hypothetical protein FACS1894164_14340 [Spirochaetia bacterium]|nr:hypothetical protein FACS1894164_14340 [Spirochaetia bacterium]